MRCIDAQSIAAATPYPEQGRTSPLDITLFKSVGLALEDLAAAELVVSSGQDGRGYNGTGT